MAEFVHLHVHSEFSLLDGLASPKALVAEAKRLYMPALALTDHGAMYGVVDFYRAAVGAGVRPVLGMETYVASRGRQDRDPQLDRSNYHLVLLAQSQAGYQNLLKLASLAQLEGFYYKPRVDKAALEQYADGLVALSACGSGEIPRLLLDGRREEARRVASWYRERFPGRFYIELQEHDIPELTPVNRELVLLADELELPLVATNDVHYAQREQAEAHDILLCIGTGKTVNEPQRMRMNNDSYYIRSAEEMAVLFAERPDSLANTLRVAEQCQVELEFGNYHLPPFDVPEGYSAESYLRHLCEEGLHWRYGGRAESDELRQRLDYELSIIHRMGFDTYFLIVWDLCQAALRRDIWWNVRGSAAGSLVAYTLGITNLDPLPNQLIFERFLNPGRVSMPDIDLDYPDDRRGEMIEYSIQKYGVENVAQIITFGTLGARAAIRDVGRALDVPLNEVDRVARLIPNVPGKPVSIPEAIEQVPELKELRDTTPFIQNLLEKAAQLEGVSRHASTHAAGVIISDRPLVDYCPLSRLTRGGEVVPGELGVVTQWPMETAESLGLLKVDFLGLSTLTIIRLACDLIEQRHGVRYDLNTIPYMRSQNSEEDAQVKPLYDLLSSGNVTGVFQVEGAGLRRTLTEMRPYKFEHVVAAISLFRPGPIEYIPTYIKRLHGEEAVEYKHPRLEPILAETYGIVVYQEQIIQIASQLAGYAPGDADQIRKAVGKKIKAKIDEHRAKFVRGAVSNGIQQEVAEAIYADIEFFARYGFNKAHAADYAVLTCQTAFLRAHYPLEYATALLTVERNNTDKIGFLINDCRRNSITVLPPDINRSEVHFVLEGDAIRFGLSAVKNVGQGAVETILKVREQGGPFQSLEDFCRRVDLRQVNRRALESLIKVGAFGEWGTRPQLLAVIERMLGFSQQMHRAEEVGQLSLFGAATGLPEQSTSLFQPLPDQTEAPLKERLAWERDLVGIYISEHPVTRAISSLHDYVTAQVGQLNDESDGTQVTVVGMVTQARRITTRKGDEMAFVTLEDEQGSCDAVVFPRLWKESRDLWIPDRVLAVNGKVERRGGETPSLLVSWAKDVRDVVMYVGSTPPGAAPASGPERPSRASPVQHAAPVARPAASPQPDTPAGPQREAVRSPQCLQVRVRRSGDHERDVQVLRRAHALLVSFAGQDRFIMRLIGGQAGMVDLDFPNDRTRYCPELTLALTELLGTGAVHVQG